MVPNYNKKGQSLVTKFEQNWTLKGHLYVENQYRYNSNNYSYGIYVLNTKIIKYLKHTEE